jgi:AhpD family alkylhydroperoxidase
MGHAGPATSAATADAFKALMQSSAAAGAIDAHTKELINFALVILARCEPCIAAHLKVARKMGISREHLDEAAWLAVAMGGAPVRMFYLEMMKKHSP